jgi:hypothetical protein
MIRLFLGILSEAKEIGKEIQVAFLSACSPCALYTKRCKTSITRNNKEGIMT